MGNKISGSHCNVSISQNKCDSKLKRGIICPICSFRFNTRYHTYANFDAHMEMHNKDDEKIASEPTIIPDDVLFPDSEAKILPIRDKLLSIRVPWNIAHLNIHISRSAILKESLVQILNLSSMELRSEFHVMFNGEIAHDAGGLTKEWLGLLINEVFNEKNGLFRLSNSCEPRYLPTPHNENVEYYFLTGLVLGKAIFENIPLNCALCKPLLKHLLNQKCHRHDLKHQDQDLYNSFHYMQNNQIEGLIFENFSVTYHNQTYEFIKNGQNIPITDENKENYIHFRTEYELYGSMKIAIEAIKSGFYKIIPHDLLTSFKSTDLDYLICGNPIINLKDWKGNTEYSGGYCGSNKIIVWFWDVIFMLNQKSLRELLQFVTGTSRVPIEGFAGLKTIRGDPARFKIVPIDYHEWALPRAHTCFNRLDLPRYPNRCTLKAGIATILANHTLGFGLD